MIAQYCDIQYSYVRTSLYQHVITIAKYWSTIFNIYNNNTVSCCPFSAKQVSADFFDKTLLSLLLFFFLVYCIGLVNHQIILYVIVLSVRAQIHSCVIPTIFL